MDDAEIEEEERKSNTDKKVHNFFFAFQSDFIGQLWSSCSSNATVQKK